MSPVVHVEDLRKHYRGADKHLVPALDGVSFDVPQGQICGILGPNGAGKSTLIKILTTILPPTSGRASVMGYDVVRQGLEVRKQLAVVLQQTAVETMLTVEDNLRIYAYLHGVSKSETNARIKHILEEFELANKVKETVQDLSIGSKRRVQIAKIFMVDAPVIFLDESTTGMDPMMKRRVLDRIRRESMQGKTIILTTQILEEAEELCDRILIINTGKLLAAGTLHELRKLSSNMFRVNLIFHEVREDLPSLLGTLAPAELKIEGDSAEMLFRGEESALLGQLAKVSEVAAIRSFEARAVGLEDIFVELVGAVRKPTTEADE